MNIHEPMESLSRRRAPESHPSLRVVVPRKKVNLRAAERAVADLLVALGKDPTSEHLSKTPRRVARSFAELLTLREFDLTTFPNDEGYDELVLAKSIPVESLCEGRRRVMKIQAIVERGVAVAAIRSRAGLVVLAMLIAGLGVGYSTAAGGDSIREVRPVAAVVLPDTVTIKNFAFEPATMVVSPGAKIAVINQDRAPHTVTARDKSFDTGTIGGGQRGEFTAPTSPGTYPYICSVHPSMVGTLIVK